MISFASIAAWFVTSKVGRAIAAGAAIALAIGIAVLKVFSAGKDAERARQDRQSLENLRSRAKTDDEVHRLSDSDLNKRLDRWVRPDNEW
jgi:uncharacterized membrane protein YraQ (UPF0718 family)